MENYNNYDNSADDSIAMESVLAEPLVHKGVLTRSKETIVRQKNKLAVAALVGSVAVTLAINPMHELEHKVIDAAPWVGSGLLVGEAAWIGGAALALGAVGVKVRNPLKIKSQFKDIATHTDNSKMFKIGFWTNTTAAVAEFGILTAGVMKYLPPEAWGALSFGALDLAATVTFRKMILSGIKNAANSKDAEPTD
ncbi:MAG: hypothetical protein WCJ05_02775 [bacterium]